MPKRLLKPTHCAVFPISINGNSILSVTNSGVLLDDPLYLLQSTKVNYDISTFQMHAESDLSHTTMSTTSLV